MCQCIMSQKQSFRFKKWVGQSALRHIQEDNQQWDGDLSLTKCNRAKVLDKCYVQNMKVFLAAIFSV